MDNWRNSLESEQQCRVEQVETYGKNFGYDLDSDQELIAKLVQLLDTSEWVKQKLYDARPFWVKWVDGQVQRNAKKFDGYRPYTCRLFRRVDWLIYWLRGRKPHWAKGRLCIQHWEANSYFPNWAYSWACDVQNKHYWTRVILDYQEAGL